MFGLLGDRHEIFEKILTYVDIYEGGNIVTIQNQLFLHNAPPLKKRRTDASLTN